MSLDDIYICLLVLAVIIFTVKISNEISYRKIKKNNFQIHGKLYAFSENSTPFVEEKETFLSIKDGAILIQQNEIILQVPLMSVYEIAVTAFGTYAYVFLKEDVGRFIPPMKERYGQSVINRTSRANIEENIIKKIRGVKPFQKDITADLCFVEFNYPEYKKVIYGILVDKNANSFKKAYKRCLSKNKKHKKNHPPYKEWKDDVKIDIGSYSSECQEQVFCFSKYQNKSITKIITQRVEYNTANNTTIITAGGSNSYALLYQNQNQRQKLGNILTKVLEYDEDAKNNNSKIENKIVGLLEFNQYIFGLVSTRLIENIEIPVSFSCSYSSNECYSKIKLHIEKIPLPLDISSESTLLDIENVKKLLNLISDETINNILESRKNDKH